MFWQGRGFVKSRTKERLSPIEFMILSSLANGEKYGYQIIKELYEKFSNVWIPKSGTIYPILVRLAQKGLIHATDTKEGRKIYKITEKGISALKLAADIFSKETLFAQRMTRYVERNLRRLWGPRYYSPRILQRTSNLQEELEQQIELAHESMTSTDFLAFLKQLEKQMQRTISKIEEYKKLVENEIQEKEKKMYRIKIE
ncbi:MAG: PadR family transcriptional regulator [Candidatus Odinarchaeota archaeon]|nr:PadR family transcriptional regulator [Candidatus Odinarchaeota archaeon]